MVKTVTALPPWHTPQGEGIVRRRRRGRRGGVRHRGRRGGGGYPTVRATAAASSVPPWKRAVLEEELYDYGTEEDDETYDEGFEDDADVVENIMEVEKGGDEHKGKKPDYEEEDEEEDGAQPTVRATEAASSVPPWKRAVLEEELSDYGTEEDDETYDEGFEDEADVVESIMEVEEEGGDEHEGKKPEDTTVGVPITPPPSWDYAVCLCPDDEACCCDDCPLSIQMRFEAEVVKRLAVAFEI